MVKECIMLHLGQAGCQVGLKCWELFCEEHGIDPSGVRSFSDDMSEEQRDQLMDDTTFESFFSATSSGQHVPRAIFADTDPRSKEGVLASEYKKLFHPDTVIGYKEDCKNNFFTGWGFAKRNFMADDLIDRVRLAVDACNNLQGFFVFHSLGGGTGTGVGSVVLEQLHERFDKKCVFQPVIYPSKEWSSCIVEPYNCILGLHHSKEFVDLTMMLDNQKAYNMCETNLKIKNPTFDHLNHIIAQFISATTASLRFEAELNATLPEIRSNLVPFPDYRYPLLSLCPLRAKQSSQHENFTTAEIVTDLFNEKCILADCENISQNRYLSACVLLRGKVSASEDPEAKMSTTGSLARGSGREVPIPFNEAIVALRNLMKPKGNHRTGLKFLPFCENGGFKVGVVNKAPTTPKSFQEFMAPSRRQGALLGNSTAVRQLFVRQYTKFLKLFFHKAYVWQFLEADGETDTFYDAKDTVRDIIDKYETMLLSSVREENAKATAAGQPQVRLEGQTEGQLEQ